MSAASSSVRRFSNRRDSRPRGDSNRSSFQSRQSSLSRSSGVARNSLRGMMKSLSWTKRSGNKLDDNSSIDSHNSSKNNPRQDSSNAGRPSLTRARDRSRSQSRSLRDLTKRSLRSIMAQAEEIPIPRQPRTVRKFRNVCGRVVNDERVQVFIIFLIIVNAVMMGAATFDFVTDDPEVSDVFEAVDMVFLVIFTIELALQFIYHLWRLFIDGWLLFDFIIIMMSWVFSDVQIIRSFRIFRALRLITRIEVMKNLVSALLSVVPKMLAITMLLLLIFYIFAVMFTSLFKELYDDGFLDFDYFGTIWDSLFTCYQFMTLDDWNPIAREVMVELSWAWFPMIAFIIISGFIVINLVIAVLCDAVSALHDDPEEGDGGEFLDEIWEEEDNITNLDGMLAGDPSHDTSRDGHDDYRRDRKLVRRASHESLQGLKDDPVKSAVSKINDERNLLKRRVDVVENQIEELTRLQSRTMQTLHFLISHVQEANER